MTGETASAADGTHPTGIHSCLDLNFETEPTSFGCVFVCVDYLL